MKRRSKTSKAGGKMLATARIITPSSVLQKIGSVKAQFEKFDAVLRLQHYKIKSFEPNVKFEFERGNYVVKTASDGTELEACLRLRYDVFHREFMNKKRTVGVDIDKLDYDCDHLVILDKRDSKVIGTYRMNSSLYTDSFYSTSEFNIDKVLALPGNKLELGRACIDKDHRNGVVIALLWRGIAEYIGQTDTRVLFGCGSIKTMEPLEIGLCYKHLQDLGHITYDLGVEPTKKYKVKQLDKVMEYIESNPYEYVKSDVAAMIPTLFQAYIKAGAKICGEPAIDRDFHCIDFLTVLQMNDLSPLYKGKYKV
jgi:putative hemolysin